MVRMQMLHVMMLMQMLMMLTQIMQMMLMQMMMMRMKKDDSCQHFRAALVRVSKEQRPVTANNGQRHGRVPAPPRATHQCPAAGRRWAEGPGRGRRAWPFGRRRAADRGGRHHGPRLTARLSQL